MRHLALLPLLAIAALAAPAKEPASAPSIRIEKAFLPGGEINDRRLLDEINSKTDALVKSGRTIHATNLIAQLSRKSCKIKLAKPSATRLDPESLATKTRAGTLVVSGFYKCTRCPNWHTSAASGFMLTADGAFTTSYHVVDNAQNEALVILTGEGRLAPVIEVLAADKVADIAILRAEGSGFTPLPVSTNALAGAKITVISHPDNHFYALSEGIISRRFLDTTPNGTRSMLSITADFGKGSSGAPVFDQFGTVIGSVNNTQSVYYDIKNGQKDNLQMVFKNCVSMRHLLDLIAP